MKLRTLAGSLAFIIVLVMALLVASAIWLYLTEYGVQRVIVAGLTAFLGIGTAFIAYFVIVANFKRDSSAMMVILILLLLVLIPALSMFYSGKVTYARFGLTVYGAIPIPVLDITVRPNGLLWFRDKSHFVSVNEVRPLLDPGVETLIIGNGWEGRVKVDPAVFELPGVTVYVLRTPDAFDLFNQFKSTGRKVALLAHTSC
jgi:hypothetical protein